MSCGLIRLICELPSSDYPWNWENSSQQVVFDVKPEEVEATKQQLAQYSLCEISEWPL